MKVQVTQKKVQIIHLHLSRTSDSPYSKKHFLSYYGRIESDANNNESRDCTFGSFLHVYCYASRQCTAEYIIKFCSKSILCVAHRDDFNSESMKHDKISR